MSHSLEVDAFNLLQLNPIKNEKSYPDMYEVIQLYLHMDIFSMGHANGSLVTNAANSAASCIWEYQLHLAVKDRSLCVLFDNKGDMFNGKGFEMLAALNHLCCPVT